MDIIFVGMPDNLYGDKIRKNFFKSESERNLWIKLNAERVLYSWNIVNNVNKTDLGNIDLPYSPMSISFNQLEYDEHECEAPRFSLEELLLLSQPEMFKLADKRNIERIKKMFGNSKDI